MVIEYDNYHIIIKDEESMEYIRDAIRENKTWVEVFCPHGFINLSKVNSILDETLFEESSLKEE